MLLRLTPAGALTLAFRSTSSACSSASLTAMHTTHTSTSTWRCALPLPLLLTALVPVPAQLPSPPWRRALPLPLLLTALVPVPAQLPSGGQIFVLCCHVQQCAWRAGSGGTGGPPTQASKETQDQKSADILLAPCRPALQILSCGCLPLRVADTVQGLSEPSFIHQHSQVWINEPGESWKTSKSRRGSCLFERET